MPRFSLLCVFLMVAPYLWAQPTLNLDSIVLGPEQYINWVLEHHPQMQNANLLIQQTEAVKLQAKGGFDPKLYGEWDQKAFSQSDYWRIGEGGVKIPSWYGLSFKGAYTYSQGVFLNAERTIPDEGQAVLGIELTALRGLVIDERRANLRKAEVQETINRAEWRTQINNLLMAALESYWNWVLAANQRIIVQEGLDLANQRLRITIESFKLGDLPAIDTLETNIQVQSREVDLADAELNYLQASQDLANFLWFQAQYPMQITDDVNAPELGTIDFASTIEDLNVFLETLDITHPELLSLDGQLSQLEVDRKLAAEQLKPQLDLSYNFLGNGANLRASDPENGGAFEQIFQQNYKWDLKFSFPLFLRKERGKLELTELKILETGFKFQQKRQELTIKLKNLYQAIRTLEAQIDLNETVINQYGQLLDAEYQKLNIGESSIFLVNSREQSLISARLKQAALQIKLQQTKVKLEWTAGQLFEQR